MEERWRLKQRISKVFRSPLRYSCSINSRDVADAVQHPVFVPRRYDHGNNLQEYVFRRPDLSHGLPRLSGTCGGGRPSAMTRHPEKKSRKKEKKLPEVGDRERRTCPPASPVSPSYHRFKQMKEELEGEQKRIAVNKKKKELQDRKKKLLSNGYGFTSSSSEGSDHDDVGVPFGSDDGDSPGETETLFSSRSFSSDSSDFLYYSSRRRSRRKNKTPPRRQRRQQKPIGEHGEQSMRYYGSLGDGFRPLVSVSSSSSSSSSSYLSATARPTHEDMAAEVMREEEMEMGTAGFAMEKQSSDPHEDFRSSMLEMIMEKQMFGARDLENLLLCYLSLNSPRHHPIILEVFSEIKETLFGY